jgi:hypothetical protein
VTAAVVLMLIRSLMWLVLSQGSPVAPSTPAGLDASDLRLVRAKLHDLGRPDVVFDRKDAFNGRTAFSGDGGTSALVLGPKGDIVRFEAEGSPRAPEPDVALKRGRRIILATHRHLPEGRFLVDAGPALSRRVSYRQRALGYDYVNGDIVRLRLGCEGDLIQYYAYRPAPRPKAVPPKICTVKEIEEAATRWASSKLEKDTPSVHWWDTVHEQALGWFYDARTGRVVFAYDVVVGFMCEGRGGDAVHGWCSNMHGGSGDYFFDAVTCEHLEEAPRYPGD